MSRAEEMESQQPVIADRAEIAAQRAGVYGFLAALFHRPLSGEVLRELREPPLLAALAAAGVDLNQEFLERREAALLDELAVDFTQLFHGPRGQIVPYESVQTGSEGAGLDGPAALDVRRFLECEGLELGVRELPDHISVELALMAALTQAEARAWDTDDADEAERLRLRQRDFMAAHLGRWAPDFARAVKAKATTTLYHETARLLADFVEAERHLLDDGDDLLSELREGDRPSWCAEPGKPDLGRDSSPHGSFRVVSVA